MRTRLVESPPSSVDGDELAAMNEDFLAMDEYLLTMDEQNDISFENDMIFEDDYEHEFGDIPDDIYDGSQLLFNRHEGSIISCDIHPSGTLAVTGSDDNMAYVWCVETGRIVMNCVGHEHSLAFVGFSFDGSYLATVDECGIVNIWKCNLENSEPWLVRRYRANGCKWGMWHFSANLLIIGAYIGKILVLDIDSLRVKILDADVPVECGKIFPNGTNLAVGYKDGSIMVWDIVEGSLLHHIDAGHKMKIKAIDVNRENNLIASISNDGTVVLSSPSSGEVVAQWKAEDELETVSFFTDGDQNLMALCCLNGSVNIWDVDDRKMRNQCGFPCYSQYGQPGITKTILVNNILVTGSLEGAVRCYNPKIRSPVKVLSGHITEIKDLCYNKQKNLVLAAASDGTARIFIQDFDIFEE